MPINCSRPISNNSSSKKSSSLPQWQKPYFLSGLPQPVSLPQTHPDHTGSGISLILCDQDWRVLHNRAQSSVSGRIRKQCSEHQNGIGK